MESNGKSDQIVAIIAASEFSVSKFRELKKMPGINFLAAVDGGYATCQKFKFMPGIVLGDFDSLGYEPSDINCFVYPKDKDESDLELALKKLYSDGYRKFRVFGALGARLDHTIAAIRACAIASSRGCDVEMYGIAETIVFLSGEGYFEKADLSGYTTKKPATVSLMPVISPCKGLSIRGLKYEADDADIDASGSLCLSNESTDNSILIGLEKGTIAIIINTV